MKRGQPISTLETYEGGVFDITSPVDGRLIWVGLNTHETVTTSQVVAHIETPALPKI